MAGDSAQGSAALTVSRKAPGGLCQNPGVQPACPALHPPSAPSPSPGTPQLRAPPDPHLRPLCVLPLKCSQAGRSGGASKPWPSPQFHHTASPHLGWRQASDWVHGDMWSPTALQPARVRVEYLWRPLSLGLLESSLADQTWSVAARTRPCGGRWPACGRSTPSSRKSSTRYEAGRRGAQWVPSAARLTVPLHPTAHPVPHLAGAVEPDPGGEEKDVRHWGCLPLSTRPWAAPSPVCCELGATEASERQLTPPLPRSPLMLNDSSSAHSMPKYGRQYSLEHIHGSGPYSVSACAADQPGWVGAAGTRARAHLPLMAGSIPSLQRLQPLLPRCCCKLRTHHLRHH